MLTQDSRVAFMRPILFLLSPAFGHYHATYKLAAQLKERGYSVTYAGESIYRQSVESLGFTFCEFSFASLVRDRYARIRYFRLDLVRFFLSNLLTNNRGKKYGDYVAASKQAKAIVASMDPALILLDIHISTLYLLLVQTGKPCFQICTTLSTNRAALIPPLNSGFIPKRTVGSKTATAFLWYLYSLRNAIDYLFQKVIYAGTDNDSYLRKFAKENGIRPSDYVNKKALKTEKIPIPELVFAPGSFDYPWRTEAANVSYVGPSVLMERADNFDSATSVLFERLEQIKKRHPSSKTVYCSLGTINYWQNKNCLQFFKKVIAAFGNRSGWFIIMVIGKDISREDLGNIPDNINVFSVVPQIKVLSVSDVMITHGGFNTVKECILSEVPMVVYPLSDLWDQQGNAARVVYHKIGLSGSLEKDTPQEIFSRVTMLFQEQEFKTNISAMRKSFEELNNAGTGVEKIDSFVNGRVNLSAAR